MSILFFKTPSFIGCVLVLTTLLNSMVCMGQSNPINFHELMIQSEAFNKKTNVLFEDSLGYLWIGSKSGLYRYDGYNLVAYRYDVFDSNSIPNNSVNSIIEDAYKNLWIGTESYLAHFDRRRNRFKGYYRDSKSQILYHDSEGHIWATSKNTQLVLITPSRDTDSIRFDTHFNYTKNLQSLAFNNQINAFVEDTFKRYWVGTSKGIFGFSTKKGLIETNFKKNIQSLKRLKNNKFLALTDQGLFVLSYNKSSLNLEVLEQYDMLLNPFSKKATLTCLSSVRNNTDFWIGSSDGLIKVTRVNNRYRFKYFSNNPAIGNLFNNQINSTLVDSNNNLWLGTLKGVYKNLGRTAMFEFNQLQTKHSKKNTATKALFFYDERSILLGRSDGLYNYNPQENRYTKIKTAIGGINVIAQSYEKDLLFLSNQNTIYKTEHFDANKNSLQLTKVKTFDPGSDIQDMVAVSQNELWVGLWNGGIQIIRNRSAPLSRFKNQVMSKLASFHISTLLLAKNNELWIGTRGHGLFRLNFTNETMTPYRPSKKNGLSSEAILCLYEDSLGNVWIGTRGGGLNKYDAATDTLVIYGASSGLEHESIAAIEADGNEHLWMSTLKGISRLDVALDKFIHFGFEDGVEESLFQFNSSTANRSHDKLYFGCSDGFYKVTPSNFTQKTTLSPTIIADFQTLGSSKNKLKTLDSETSKEININTNEPIILPYNQNNIVINFSSLDLTSPRKNRYAYMLEGLSKYWIYTNASNRNANYNDLPAGNYTFKVKSTNSDGVWNETPAVIKFSIKPPVWASHWAIFTYCVLALVLLYIAVTLIIHWYHLKDNLMRETISREKDNELSRMKMVFFTDISHELRTPLTLILGTIEKIVKSSTKTISSESALRIYNNSLRMNRLINKIMDIQKFDVGEFNLKVSKDNICNDFLAIKNAFNDFAKIYHISYEFTRSQPKIKAWYDVEILEKIVFNLLSNAFKYTPEHGKISVHVEKTNDSDIDLPAASLKKGTYIKCAIRDNGVGISEKDLPHIFDRYYQATKLPKHQVSGTGIGMELVQKLLEIHHGHITVESEENSFTEFTFYLPIQKKHYSDKDIGTAKGKRTNNLIEASEFKVIRDTYIDTNTPSKKTDPSKPKVLIVEDNLELRTMIKEALQDVFEILEASSGREGYDLALTKKPKVIISDILMPIEDGLSMLKRLKETPKTKDIPVFMLTAKNENETKIESLKLGAEDHIEKPFSLEFVKWKILNALDTRKELKEKFSQIITPVPSEIIVDSNEAKFIRKLVTIIENHIEDPILGVEFLASEVGLSRSHLYRKLQATVDDTPVNFIKKIKLKRAEQLLKESSMYIAEIAYTTGFKTPDYFGKCFVKEFGISPSQYRKKHRQKITIE